VIGTHAKLCLSNDGVFFKWGVFGTKVDFFRMSTPDGKSRQ
jgi:hypothetical protein